MSKEATVKGGFLCFWGISRAAWILGLKCYLCDNRAPWLHKTRESTTAIHGYNWLGNVTKYMDSTSVKAFALLLQESLKTSPSSGNGFGLALASILCMGALCILGLVIIDRRATKYRDRIDAERKLEWAESRREATDAVAKAERKAIEERERDERATREQRERDESAARERAKSDQADREQAREKLMQHTDAVIEKLGASILATVGKLEDSIRTLQGECKDHAERIVSLEKEVEHLKEIRKPR